MATKPTVGHKRTRSLDIRVILIRFSALLSSDADVTSTVRKSLSGIILKKEIPDMTDEAILRAFSTSSSFCNILRELGVREPTDDERKDIESQYRLVYEIQGCKQLRLDPQANSFLNAAARQAHLRLATLSNNPVLAADLVEKLGVNALEAVISTSSLNGMTEPSETHKTFHSDIWNRLILPWFNDPIRGVHVGWETDSPELDDSVKELALEPTTTTTTTPQATSQPGGTPNPPPPGLAANNLNPNNYHGQTPPTTPLQPSEVMVISCAQYDLDIAKAAGMQTCWVRVRKTNLDNNDTLRAGAGPDYRYNIVASNWNEVRLKLLGDSGDGVAVARGNALVDEGDGKGGHGMGNVEARADEGVGLESISEEQEQDDGDLVMHEQDGVGEEQVEKQAGELLGDDVDETAEGNAGDDNDADVDIVAGGREVVQMEICDD